MSLAAGLFTLLGLLLFQLYRVGASAWQKSDAELDLMRDLQVVLARLNRDAQGSTYGSLSRDATALSFLTAVSSGSSPQFVVDPITFRPVWQRYLVYYYTPASQTLAVREEPMVPPATSAAPIESVAGQPLSSYCNSGRPLATHVTLFQVDVTDPDLLEVTLEGRKKRYGSERLETLRMKTTVRMRN